MTDKLIHFERVGGGHYYFDPNWALYENKKNLYNNDRQMTLVYIFSFNEMKRLRQSNNFNSFIIDTQTYMLFIDDLDLSWNALTLAILEEKIKRLGITEFEIKYHTIDTSSLKFKNNEDTAMFKMYFSEIING